uniref:Uncharacterized protein n=1 Tax=Schistosoma japonicum TaxID=6182 RepID=C1LKR5_SCHJA|nr:hypothetical protein [Schistosoma japonicum]CAX75293.1 hypothetical protein [Schistosoma japonicum]
MDLLYNQLHNLHCLSINDYLMHSNQFITKCKQLNTNSNVVVTSPELLILLRRLCYKFGIINAAYHFADNIKTDQLDENISKLTSQGHSLLKQLNDQFSIANISEIKRNSIQLELNKIYEKFNQYENELQSIYQKSIKQIEITNNRLNVTNRLIGYRNNWNCINSMKDKQVHQPDISRLKRPQIAPRFNVANYDQISCEVLDQSNQSCSTKKNDIQWPPTIQEQAGICINYPGESENHSAFIKPIHCVSEVLTNHGELRECIPGYRINPHSEIKLDGYNPIKQHYALSSIDKSEYTQAYIWPDGKKIHTSPWNRSKELDHLNSVK